MIPNMWYPICRPQDVPRREPVGLRRLGEDIVLFRDENGGVVCMQDRCAHKGAKLSARLPGISRLSIGESRSVCAGRRKEFAI